MAGVPGSGGPVPKPKDKKLGHISKAERASTTKVPGVEPAEIPEADPEWHPVAQRWFGSLARSGQSVLYQESDWAAAFVLAESMSRELSPQPMVVGKGADAHLEMVLLPPKSASISSWLKGMTALLATEGDRRRLAIELEVPKSEETDAGVSWLDDARRRAGDTA